MNSHQRLVEIHIAQARSRALRLFAFTSAVFPGEWSNQWIETIVPDLVEFAFHARKVNEFCGLMNHPFPSINVKLVSISSGDPGDWETSYRNALNALMHMRSFVVGNTHSDHRRIFLASEANLITLYIRVSTDKFPATTISIFGLVNCFLNEVLPQVRMKYPSFAF